MENEKPLGGRWMKGLTGQTVKNKIQSKLSFPEGISVFSLAKEAKDKTGSMIKHHPIYFMLGVALVGTAAVVASRSPKVRM